MIRVCPDHGYFDGETCPVCGESGTQVLSADRRTRLSKFLSGALRHFPDDVGLELDDHGWTDEDALVKAATGKYAWAEPEHVEAVIETDPKGRFERHEDQVRAAYGHSVDIDLESTTTEVPDELYHGTSPEDLDSILSEGLKPMGRQYVHLSATRSDARDVGRRHADDPVVLAIDTRSMSDDGLEIDKRGPETYIADYVPPRYIELDEESRND